MKKFLALLLCFCTLASLSTGAFAAEITQSGAQNGHSTVRYGVDVGYTVTIPETVALNTEGIGTANISIANAMLPSGSALNVSITGDSYSVGSWHLTNVDNADDKLSYIITSDNKAEYFADGNLVLTAVAGEIPHSSKTKVLDFEILSNLNKAGSYNDTLTFTVETTGILSGDLAGSYRMLAIKPTIDTAIRVDYADAHNDTKLLEQYGVPVESGADLGEGYVLTGLTPWLYTEYPNGDIVFFGAGVGQYGSRTHGYWTMDELDEIYSGADGYESALVMFGYQEFSISADTQDDVSEEVKKAFMASHRKYTDEVRDYFQMCITSGSQTFQFNVFRDTWEENLKSPVWDLFAEMIGANFAIVRDMVVVRTANGDVPVTLNGEYVLATDILQPYYEIVDNDGEYTDNRYVTTADVLLEYTCLECGEKMPIYFACPECKEYCSYHLHEHQN